MTAEQLEAARAERLRQNGHGATTIEDVRTWIEETGLCIFLPRSAQAGFTAPTFVEAVAGQRTTEPTLELISSAESLLVRLEAEGVAVRLNLAGQPGDQPDYVVAGWVLPYIYALRGDRDWRRSPQLTGSRQVSPLAVQAAKQLETANLTATQIRDLLGRETTETAVLRALHELWKQLRIIPVVPEVGSPALWQPLRQRFQKAIAEGASTSQVTAISVLASIYLQAVIAASMEDVELFLSPLTSRSKIREVVRGLAATRQVHSTPIGHSPMFYVAGTLPEFPSVPSYQIGTTQSAYRSSSYRSTSYLDSYLEQATAEERHLSEISASASAPETIEAVPMTPSAHVHKSAEPVSPRHKPVARSAASSSAPGKAAPPRPRAGKTAGSAHPRERSRTGAPAPAARSRSGSFSNGNGHRASATNGHHTNGSNGHHAAKPAVPVKNGAHKPSTAARPAWGARANGNGATNGKGAKPSNGARPGNRHAARPAAAQSRSTANGSSNGTGRSSANGLRNGAAKSGKAASSNGVRNESRNRSSVARPVAKSASRDAAHPRAAEPAKRKPAAASAAKRYSFSGQAKQAPKPAAKRASAAKPAPAAARSSRSARPAAAKRRG